MSELRFNPWDVRSLYELQVYDCPECVFQDWSKQIFINHAVDNHPDSIQYLNNIQDGSLDDVEISCSNKSYFKNEDKENQVEEDIETNVVPENNSSITIKVKVDDLNRESDKDDDEQNQHQDETITEVAKIQDFDDNYDSNQEVVENEPIRIPESLDTKSNDSSNTKSLPLKCDICHKDFSCSTSLKYHSRMCKRWRSKSKSAANFSSVTLTPNSFYLKCETCYKDCTDSTSLKKHASVCKKTKTSEEHPNDQLQCEKCKENFDSHYQLEMHLAIAHIKDCPGCPQKFDSTGDLVTHLEEVHDINEYACFSCDVIFQTPKRKQKHMEHCDEGYKCSICKVTRNCQTTLKHHIKSIHKKIFDKKCDQCEMTFPTEARLTEHIFKRHIDVGKSYPCPICGKSYLHQKSVTDHIRKVHEKRKKERLYPCDQCHKVFKNSKKSLFRHIQNVHSNEKLCFQCDQCGKKLTSQNSLTLHIKATHDKIKNFKCQHCPKKFSWPASLKWHIESAHAVVKSHICGTCKLPLCSKGALKQHETVHDPNPKFKCGKCGKGFKYKNNFFEHVKVLHEGKRDFKCDICGKEFVRLSYLQKHQNSAHENVSETMTSDDKSSSSQFEAAKCSNLGLI